MSLTGNWNYPTSVHFGVGRIAELADTCRSQGIERPLLVTDSGLARAPMTIATLDALRAAGLGVALFCDLKPNPVEANLAGGSTPGAPATTTVWSPSAAAVAWTWASSSPS